VKIAAKRWFRQHSSEYCDFKFTILGDDLYCKQPICELILDQGFDFILVCKPESHKTLYQWVEELVTDDIETITVKRWTGKIHETDTYQLSTLPDFLRPRTYLQKLLGPNSQPFHFACYPLDTCLTHESKFSKKIVCHRATFRITVFYLIVRPSYIIEFFSIPCDRPHENKDTNYHTIHHCQFPFCSEKTPCQTTNWSQGFWQGCGIPYPRHGDTWS